MGELSRCGYRINELGGRCQLLTGHDGGVHDVETEVRRRVTEALAPRRADDEFRERLRERMELDRRLLERIEEGPVDWRSAWAAEAAKFQAETVTTSFLAKRLREEQFACDYEDCRKRGTTVVVLVGALRGWVCDSCADRRDKQPTDQG